MEKVIITKKENLYKVAMEVTQGKILSMIYALEARESPVGKDLLDLVKEAAKDAGIQL